MEVKVEFKMFDNPGENPMTIEKFTTGSFKDYVAESVRIMEEYHDSQVEFAYDYTDERFCALIDVSKGKEKFILEATVVQ
jgi:hypothetical protein